MDNILGNYIDRKESFLSVVNRGVSADDTPGTRLKKARLDKNISIKDFAMLCGVSPTCISYNEGNKHPASLANLRKFAESLQVTIAYLGKFDDLPETTAGQRLLKARQFAGLTKVELSMILGVDVKTILSWESDKRSPSPQHQEIINKFIHGE